MLAQDIFSSITYSSLDDDKHNLIIVICCSLNNFFTIYYLLTDSEFFWFLFGQLVAQTRQSSSSLNASNIRSTPITRLGKVCPTNDYLFVSVHMSGVRLMLP